MRLKKLFTNCLIVIILATITFLLHLFINNLLVVKSIGIFQLMYSYVINISMACGVIVILFALKKKLKDQLGFIFLGASMLKFVLFFILFYPVYKADGFISRLEFLTFFVPYMVCLVTESIILSKFLNSLDNYN